MIRRLALLLLLTPALSLAASGPCGPSPLAPLPATVPAPEMQRSPIAAIPCVDLAAFTARMRQPAAPAAAAAAPAGAYVPKTQFDNSPWRFDMQQNGRRMTADEFDAWMKAKGIRVATGKPAAAGAAAATPASAPAATPAATCTPSATVKC